VNWPEGLKHFLNEGMSLFLLLSDLWKRQLDKERVNINEVAPGLLEVDLHRCGDNVGHCACDMWEAGRKYLSDSVCICDSSVLLSLYRFLVFSMIWFMWCV
jgi:hypothetical protein